MGEIVMADIKMFNIKEQVKEFLTKQITLEREFQKLLKENMSIF